MIPKLDEYKNRWGIESENDIKPGLHAITTALSILGNPEKQFKVIHVAGTNGKGSTIAFMESILKEQGYQVGVFSSPAIKDIHDQIRLSGEAISQELLDLSFKEMKEAGLSGKLTDFELLTVAAFCTFRRIAPDYALIETGMGGTYDSTNVVDPLVSVITSIAVEHSNFLGDTVEEVASHKAGIIKKGKPVVLGPLGEAALSVVRKKAIEQCSEVSAYGEDFWITDELPEVFVGKRTITLQKRKMKGDHQRHNAALAIEALLKTGIQISDENIQSGIAQTTLRHRFQEVQPGVYVDGAHNPAAAKALAKTIQYEFPNEKVDFYIGMVKGKDIENTLDALMPVASSFTFLSFDHPQAESAERLMLLCKHKHKKVTKLTGDTIILDKESESQKIVTGSLYLLERLKTYAYGI